MHAVKDLEYTTQHFEKLRRLVLEYTGIVLSDAKQELVYGRLARRLRALGMRSFEQYCQLLADGDAGERTHFVNSVTTNLTAFFREPHHFEFLADALLPEIAARKATDRRLRVWSSAASTGEEPYTLAMVIAESLPERDRWDVKILATDIDSDVLDKGRRGVYALDRISGITAERQRRWFRRGVGRNTGYAKVVPELQDMITFRQLNLMDDWPMRGPFDFIFCRNVVIYFDKPTQRVLFERFANLLAPRGHICIGHSESLFQVSDRYELLGKTIYRKLD